MTHRLYLLVPMSLITVGLTSMSVSFLLATMIVTSSLVFLLFFRYLSLLEVLVFLGVFVVIFFRFTDAFEPSLVVYQQDLKETIIGEVTQVKHQEIAYQRFLVTPESQSSNILVTHFDSIDFDLVPGQRLRLQLTFESPEQPQNPGMFDYDRYLLTENVTAKAVAQKIDYEGEAFFTPVFAYRLTFLDWLQKQLSETSFGLVSALVLGERSLLDDSFKELFTRWHLTHLLAISGLHVGLMVHILSLFLSRIGRLSKETMRLVLMLVFICFPFIAGGTPSVFRASLVGLLGYLALVIRTKVSTLDALSFVFLLLMIIKPHWLYQLGFQYSFLVTFSLVLSRPILLRIHKPLLSLTFITFLSFFITLPLQLSKFYSVNLFSLFINPLVNLLFSFLIIPLCFGMVIIALFIPVLLPVVDGILAMTFNGLFFVLTEIDRLFYLPFVTGKPHMFHLILYVIILFLLLRAVDQTDYKKAGRYGWVIVLTVSMIKAMPYLNPYGQVTQLSIGQANALVIELPHRQGVYLYDIGATTGNDYVEVTDEAYTRVVKPFLHYRGIHRINGVFLSHSHQDHIGSLPFLIEDFRVDRIYINAFFDQASVLPGIDYTILEANQRYQMNHHDFDVVLPTHLQDDPNDESMVIHTTLGPLSFLLTGDISAQQEQVFIKRYPNKQVDVLMVAHHGSQTSTDEHLLKQFTPLYAVISAGLDNSFKHPHPAVIERLNDYNVAVFRTDIDGAVIYRFHKRKGTYTWDKTTTVKK